QNADPTVRAKFFNENKHFHQIYGNPAFYHAKDARPHLKIVHLTFVFYPGLVPPYLAPNVPKGAGRPHHHDQLIRNDLRRAIIQEL
ncbi:MAG: hypothetical protein LKF64_10560, partial [Alcaligenes faecalis]|nr:hypothetical protein [Alcaligenes faecalis]